MQIVGLGFFGHSTAGAEARHLLNPKPETLETQPPKPTVSHAGCTVLTSRVFVKAYEATSPCLLKGLGYRRPCDTLFEPRPKSRVRWDRVQAPLLQLWGTHMQDSATW